MILKILICSGCFKLIKEENVLKTGTTTVALMCKDGIILGADKRATSGYLIADKKAQKIHKIDDALALTIAGSVSDAQMFIKLISAEIKLFKLRTNRAPTVSEVVNVLGLIVYNKIRSLSAIPAITQFILGGKDVNGFELYDLYPDGSITKIDDFFSTGSGSVMALGVLEARYKKDITVSEGVKLAYDALYAALNRDIASGNGIEIVSITDKGVNTEVNKVFTIERLEKETL